MDEKIVAFIDLLAFSNNVRKNTSDGMMAFSNYNTILHTKIRDGKMHPVDSYPEELKDLAKSTSIDSFEYFIPFSDSIFIVSNDANSFITQLCSFLYNCFHITSHFYVNPKDPSDPTKGDMVSFELNEEGQISTSMIDAHYYPTIFRGGMAYGEVLPIDLWGIIDNNPEKRKTVAGKAVVRAVELESKIKGPRIIFEKNILEHLEKQTIERYIRQIKDTDFCEILWPAIKYIPQNGIRDVHEFHEMFSCAINLWKGYNHTPYSEHYFCFIELIVASTIKYFSSIGYEKDVLDVVQKAIHNKGLDDKIRNLIIS